MQQRHDLRGINALKRADEFIAVGKKQVALETLHETITHKRVRTWQVALEQLMMRFVELCVELRKGRLAKDGLHQYRNVCQQVNVASLEKVIVYLIDMSEKGAHDAREKSEHKLSEILTDLDDLEETSTPESLLLSCVTTQDTKDRTDREVLTPWLKFLWESYRIVLDILKNNSKLEELYKSMALRAFGFCIKYQRKAEFRRLCDMLRQHLNNIQKYTSQATSIDLNNAESLQWQVDTRLKQLDTAIELELWQEAFKSVQDIHSLMVLSSAPPSLKVLEQYYAKLELVFLKSNNHLFHAASWHRLFSIVRGRKQSVPKQDLVHHANMVLLSTLAVPVSRPRTTAEDILSLDESQIEDSLQLARLLDLHAVPSRETLIQNMSVHHILETVAPELANLYEWLEVDFHPHGLSDKMQSVFEFLDSRPDHYRKYSEPLKQIVVMRILQQLEQVYDTVSLDYFLSLASFMDKYTAEKFIVHAIKSGNVNARICHRTRSLGFRSKTLIGSGVTPAGPQLQSLPAVSMRLQLTGLLHRLVSVQEMIAPGMLATEQAHRSHTVMMQVNKHLDTEHRRLTGRAEIIDERKNNAATQLRAAETARKRDAALARQKELEERARAKEQEDAARARAKRQQELQDLKHKQALDKIAQIKRTAVGAKALDGIDENELKGLDPDAIVAKQVEQLDKEKRDLEARKRAVERKMDHFERACREEEVPLLEKQWQDQQVSDRAWWEADVGQQRELHRRKYDTDLSLKKRMQRIAADHAAFKERLHERAQEALSKRMAKFEKFLADQRKIRENERAQREKREAEQRAIQAEQERIEEAEREERRQKDLIVARERSERQRLDAERLERAESTSWKRSEPSSRPPRDFDTRSDTSGGSGGGGGGGGAWRPRTRPVDDRDRAPLRDDRDSRDRYPPSRDDRDRYPPSRDDRDRYPPSRDDRDRYPPSRDDRDRYPPSRNDRDAPSEDGWRRSGPPSRGPPRDVGGGGDGGGGGDRWRRPSERTSARQPDADGWRQPTRTAPASDGFRRPSERSAPRRDDSRESGRGEGGGAWRK